MRGREQLLSRRVSIFSRAPGVRPSWPAGRASGNSLYSPSTGGSGSAERVSQRVETLCELQLTRATCAPGRFVLAAGLFPRSSFEPMLPLPLSLSLSIPASPFSCPLTDLSFCILPPLWYYCVCCSCLCLRYMARRRLKKRIVRATRDVCGATLTLKPG